MSEAPLLEVSSLIKTYRLSGRGPFTRKGARPALAGVSFSMTQGRSFGIVGESGPGKSTLARIALALDRPDSAPCAFRDARCSICGEANCAQRERICKWSSRTPMARSIRASASAQSSPSRWRRWAGGPGRTPRPR